MHKHQLLRPAIAFSDDLPRLGHRSATWRRKATYNKALTAVWFVVEAFVGGACSSTKRLKSEVCLIDSAMLTWSAHLRLESELPDHLIPKKRSLLFGSGLYFKDLGEVQILSNASPVQQCVEKLEQSGHTDLRAKCGWDDASLDITPKDGGKPSWVESNHFCCAQSA